jgi:hypothetical protein
LKALERNLTGITQQKSSKSGLEQETKLDPIEELKSLMSPFQDMAELNRHLIHAQETLSAAINTMQLMSQDHNKHCPLSDNGKCVERPGGTDFKPSYPLRQMSRSLTCHTSLLSNLRFRADAFERRLNNEISHASTGNVRAGTVANMIAGLQPYCSRGDFY